MDGCGCQSQARHRRMQPSFAAGVLHAVIFSSSFFTSCRTDPDKLPRARAHCRAYRAHARTPRAHQCVCVSACVRARNRKWSKVWGGVGVGVGVGWNGLMMDCETKVETGGEQAGISY